MEKYLNSGIKDLIAKFPKLADLLNEYKIGCVPCNVGSCLLKDIVEIHNLSVEDEHELMVRIAKVIYPDRQVKIPEIKRKTKAKPGDLKYSPPIKRLVDEHALIKKWIALIPTVIETVDLESAAERQLIMDGLDFIRFYADKFHHAKEENILFEYVDKNLDIIKTMLQDHETGRGHVKAVLEALKSNDKAAVSEHMLGYKDLLTEHIKKEDEILYPWLDRNLSTKQVGELFSRFNEAEGRIDKEVVEKCRKFAEEIEKRVQRLKKEKEVVK